MNEPDPVEFVGSLPPALRARVRALRALVRRSAPGLVETVLWGSLSFHRPAVGGRVRGSVCLVTAKRGQVRLEFVHGVRLADPRRRLRGDGVSKRHVEIRTVADAGSPEVEALVREAASLAWDR